MKEMKLYYNYKKNQMHMKNYKKNQKILIKLNNQEQNNQKKFYNKKIQKFQLHYNYQNNKIIM